jgi:hypothetical protein
VLVKIYYPSTVLLANQHTIISKEAEYSVAVISRDILGLFLLIYRSSAAAVLLLVLYNRRSAILNRILYCCRTLTLNIIISVTPIRTLGIDSAYKYLLILYRE